MSEEKELSPDELWAQATKDNVAADLQQTVEAGPDATAPETKADDPLSGLPEPTRKLVEQIQAKTAEQDAALRDARQKIATAHGTIGNLTQKLDASLRTLAQMKPTVEAVQAQKQAEADVEIAKKSEVRRKAREKLSDFLDPDELDVVIPDVKPEAKPEFKPEAQPTKPEPQSTTQAVDLNKVEEEKRVLVLQRELSDLVPGWMKIRETAEFKQWLPAQNDDIKAKAASWDPDEAAGLFHAFAKYKDDAAKVSAVEAQRQERLRRSESVPGRGTASTGESPSPDALWEQAKRDRDKARARA